MTSPVDNFNSKPKFLVPPEEWTIGQRKAVLDFPFLVPVKKLEDGCLEVLDTRTKDSVEFGFNEFFGHAGPYIMHTTGFLEDPNRYYADQLGIPVPCTKRIILFR